MPKDQMPAITAIVRGAEKFVMIWISMSLAISPDAGCAEAWTSRCRNGSSAPTEKRWSSASQEVLGLVEARWPMSVRTVAGS